MAELVAGSGQRLALKPEGVLVGRHSEDGSFKPDVDLADLEGGRTVSRRHARIYYRDAQWVLKVEAATTNPTVVAGHLLTTGQEVPLKDGDELTLGRVSVVFRVGSEPSPATPEAAVVEAAQPASAVEAMAELRSDGHVMPLVVQEGKELSLGRHSDDRTYHPDVDLGDLPNGRTVSRRHGRLYFRDDQWFLRVEAEVTNPTVLEGKQLALGQEVPLRDGDRLQLGRVITTFHHLRKVENVGPEQIELSVEPARLGVEAGAEEQAVVTVVNHTGHVDWFRVELEGIPQAWYRIILPDGTVGQPAQVRLFHTAAHATPSPDAVAQLRLVYCPPREPGSRAGVHPVAVSATTQGEPHLRRTTAGQLTVAPYEGLEMTLAPEEVGKPRADFEIGLRNAGNDVATVSLQPEGDGLIYQWDRPAVNAAPQMKADSKLAELGAEAVAQGAPVPQIGKRKEAPPPVLPTVRLQMANGGQERLKLAVKVKRRHWLGTDRFYSYSLTARAGQEEQTRRGRLVCPPRVPIWMQTAYQRVQSFLVPILVLVAVLGIAFAFARPADVKEFKAEPASVVVGTPVTLSWSLERATGVAIEPGSGTEQLGVPQGNLVVNPAASTKYTLTARNRVGIQSSRSVSVEVKPAPPQPRILSFTASPEHVKKEGEPVTLRWETENATKVTVEPADEVKDPKASGEATVHPTKSNATYRLVAASAAGSKDQMRTIVVDPPQVTTFAATPESVVQGADVRLRWQAQGFTKLTIKADKGEVVAGKQELEVPDGATDQVVRPLEDTEYTITATNAGGSDAKKVKVTVSQMKVLFFRADRTAIAKGQSATLSWDVQGAKSVTIDPGVGPVAGVQSSVTVSPDKNTEYTLTATSASGSTEQKKVAITVGSGPVKIDVFRAAPAAITKGEQATLTYSVQNAKRVVIKDGDGKVIADSAQSQRSVQVSPDKTMVYILTASNESGESVADASVEVRLPTPTPAPTPPPPAPPKP